MILLWIIKHCNNFIVGIYCVPSNEQYNPSTLQGTGLGVSTVSTTVIGFSTTLVVVHQLKNRAATHNTNAITANLGNLIIP